VVKGASFTAAPPQEPQSAAAPPQVVAPPQVIAPPHVVAPMLEDGPNLHGEDAPPALPAGLMPLLTAAPGQKSAARSSSLPVTISLAQPPRVHAAAPPTADRGVVTASAEAPLGIQLINPAVAVVGDQAQDGLQQAVYYEISDQLSEEPAEPATPAVSAE
jgi:hypothetical protein